MQNLFVACAVLALTAGPAAALERELVDQIVQSAQRIERDAATVEQSLKKKVSDPATVRQTIAAMSDDIAKLRQLVQQLDSTGAQLSARDQTDWQLVKDKVQLLEIFHGQKQTLASEDVNKNRSLIRAHAKGVGLRAQKLQQTAQRLRRG